LPEALKVPTSAPAASVASTARLRNPMRLTRQLRCPASAVAERDQMPSRRSVPTRSIA
jgi:hypothetical protein